MAAPAARRKRHTHRDRDHGRQDAQLPTISGALETPSPRGHGHGCARGAEAVVHVESSCSDTGTGPVGPTSLVALEDASSGRGPNATSSRFRRGLNRVASSIQARLGWASPGQGAEAGAGAARLLPPPSAPPHLHQCTQPPPKSSHNEGVLDLLRNRSLSFDPSQPLHYRWLIFVSLAVLYNLIFTIGRAVFWELNRAIPTKMWWAFDIISDSIYMLDTIVHMHEGYLEQGLMVTDAARLRWNYVRSNRWRCDLLSLLPTDFGYLFWRTADYCSKDSLPCPVAVRVNRLLRFPRMLEFFDRTETRTGYPNAFRICKVVLAILVLIHWNACLYFYISYIIGFGTDNWVYNLKNTTSPEDKNITLSRQYIYSFYWSTLTLTTIGETPQPENDLEYLFVVMDFLAGVLIFATIVGNIGSMISNMNTARVEFQNRMDGVKQYMAFRRVSKDLEARVIRWFAYTWANKQALDEERVLAALPDKLKAEIAIHVHLETLKQVEIFQDCEPGLLEELVLKLRLQVFSPGDYICRKGDVGKELYIVKRGRLSVVADDGSVVLARLGPGSVFGEVSVLEIAGNKTGNRRTANVRSLGYSDLFCLSKSDLWAALADYPDARHSLLERGCQLLRKDRLLDEEAFEQAKKEQETLAERVLRLDASIEQMKERLDRAVADLGGQQARLKQRVCRVEGRRERGTSLRNNRHSHSEQCDEGGHMCCSGRGSRATLVPEDSLALPMALPAAVVLHCDYTVVMKLCP
ncbi:cyclic nucleotide-gated cation channel subunit A [Thrips palmi]|uniref:Cyclic nucleotide-gated cation channel subunit A n=1 Tax=Thrips palmi TaxID=161013 RepID=A0A6P8Y8C6_THRPL|nr:cyclic nucleotide-gated cation channel subunit A [Thrips palmi]